MTFVYAAVGPALTCYDIDAESVALERRSTVMLPANVQYAWPHHTRRVLYVISSDGAHARGIVGNAHHLSAFAVDPETGALSPHGSPVTLPARPIHLCSDPTSRHILVAFNYPPAVQVYRVADDFTLGGMIDQPEAVDPGIFPHQVLVAPDGRNAILVSRGHDATLRQPEQPGSLNVFSYRNGRLTGQQVVAPNGGFGFGPRHLDFHPTLPFIYVSLERQNSLAMFARRQDGMLEPEPRALLPTLVDGSTGTRQFAGGVHVHAEGHVVYVANRAHEVGGDGSSVEAEGNNTIAVYAIDPASGEPRCVQNVETGGIHCRTFHITPDGRLMVAAHLAGLWIQEGQARRFVPAGLSLFRIARDGRLTLVRRHEVETNGRLLFWMGMITPVP